MNARKQRRSIAARVGQSPGVLMLPKDAAPTRIDWVHYLGEQIEERQGVAVGEIEKLTESKGVHWLDVIGLGDEATLAAVRDTFEIPWLAFADMVNVPQRPRFESHAEGALVILQIPRPGERIDLDQFSFFACGQVVISFREHDDGVFSAPHARIRDPKSRLRSLGADYLLYRLLDCAVDSYFPHIDRLEERLDAIEAAAVDHPRASSMRGLYFIRRELGTLLRAALGSRDVLSSLTREPSNYFKPDTQPYVRDVFDHLAQVTELAQHHRQAAVDIQELIVASLDMRMNQVMKVLTAVTVIFIPLSFITGLYGMNFKYMPELEWRWSYPIVLALILAIGLTILWRLKRAGWVRLKDE